MRRVRTVGSYVYMVAWAALLLLPVRPTSVAAEGDVSVLEQTGTAFASIAERAVPAVVFVQVEKSVSMGTGQGQFEFNDPFDFFGEDFMRRFFGDRGRMPQAPREPQRQPRSFKQMGQGSGFLISKDGYILTNHHVAGDADKIRVKLHDGREFDAKVIGSDDKSEVAVIKIEGGPFPYLTLGRAAAMRVGEWVVAIGNPFGLSETVTSGIVSAKGRTHVGIADYENFIQTDAAINPGNSGGPLLNIKGEVVGINTAIYSQSGGYMGIGFAIPIEMAVAIKDQLIKTGKVSRGFLGILIQPVTADLAESFGLEEAKGILVADVTKDSPAEKAGLKQGDVIFKMNGKEYGEVGTFRNAVAATPPREKVRLTVLRQGKEKELTVVLGDLAEEGDVAAAAAAESSGSFGLSVQDLTPDIARSLGLTRKEGVVITEVEPGGPAAEAGLAPGHMIESVDRKPVTSARAFRKAMAEAEKTGKALLLVKTEQGARFVSLKK